MRVVQGLLPALSHQPTVLTIGAFDGIHRGHQVLIGATVTRALASQSQSAVLTFDPHPDLVLRPNGQRLYLTSLAERTALIAALGVDLLIVQSFTHDLMALTYQEYVESIITSFPLRSLVVGVDFALGRKRTGTLPRLRELGTQLGYTVEAIEPLLLDGAPVSSTRIRAALAAGDLPLAAQLLGRPFGVTGPVVEGDRRGRTIGYPTANIAFPEDHVLPADGVYVCDVEVNGERFGAVTNVGVRPTFAGAQRRIEAHLFGFSGDIYGATVTLRFWQRLRGEQRFNGVADLIAQIQRDADAAQAWLAANNPL
jgi:riboflavin kinase/FMN adenylyltransferase